MGFSIDHVAIQVIDLNQPNNQWPCQVPKLELPTIYKAYIRILKFPLTQWNTFKNVTDISRKQLERQSCGCTLHMVDITKLISRAKMTWTMLEQYILWMPNHNFITENASGNILKNVVFTYKRMFARFYNPK